MVITVYSLPALPSLPSSSSHQSFRPNETSQGLQWPPPGQIQWSVSPHCYQCIWSILGFLSSWNTFFTFSLEHQALQVILLPPWLHRFSLSCTIFFSFLTSVRVSVPELHPWSPLPTIYTHILGVVTPGYSNKLPCDFQNRDGVGRDVRGGVQEGGDTCIPTASSCLCIAKKKKTHNTVK